MTQFRKSQVRALLRGLLVTVAPFIMGSFRLRDVVRELAADDRFWLKLSGLLPPPPREEPLPEPTRPATTPESPLMTAPVRER